MPRKKKPSSETNPISQQSFYLSADTPEVQSEPKTTRKRSRPPKRSKKTHKNRNPVCFEAVFDNSADGLVIVDGNKKVLKANVSAQKLTGLSESKFTGSKFDSHLTWSSRRRFGQMIAEAKKGKSVNVADLTWVDDGKDKMTLEVSSSPVTAENRKYAILLNLRDVSDKKKKYEEMHEQEKLQAVRHFMAGVSHEIHHPLKALHEQSKTLIKKYGHREFEYISFREFKDIMKSLEKMQDQINYCYETTGRIIAINKKRSGRVHAKTEVNPVLEKIINTIKHQFEITDIKFMLRKNKDLKPVNIPEPELTQIIQNIINNSIQSMPAGGKVQLKTSMSPNGDAVLVECKDNGVGIPNEVINRVFEPFYTTKHRGLEKNSGLGLSIVYSVLKSYRGDIDIKSTLRKGTAVVLTLPVQSASRTSRSKS